MKKIYSNFIKNLKNIEPEIRFLLFFLGLLSILGGIFVYAKLSDNKTPVFETLPVFSQNVRTFEGPSIDGLLIKLKEGYSLTSLNEIQTGSIEEIKSLGIFKLKVPIENIEIQKRKLETNPAIEAIYYNYLYKTQIIPNDSYYSYQWHLPRISAPQAWNLTVGNSNVPIAIVDTGVNINHEDLRDKIWQNSDEIPNNGIDDDSNGFVDDSGGWNFVDNNNNVMPQTFSSYSGHGTIVAGIAAGASNNNKGITGVNWNSKIMPLKALNDSGIGYSDKVATAIKYAADNGAKVINLSLGFQSDDPFLKFWIDYAYSKGAVIVAAAGNEGGSVIYPAKYDNVIAVGATDSDDVKTSWSNYGPELDVVAPGQGVLSTYWTLQNNTNLYVYASGTSMSTPQVSGLAALIFSYIPNINNASVAEFIKNRADKVAAMGGINFNNLYGNGRINSLNSLRSITDSIKITSPFSYSNLNPAVGEELVAKYALTNRSSVAATIDASIANYFVTGSRWESFSRQTYTLSPGETKSFTFQQIVKGKGAYKAWVVFRYNGVWYDAKPETNQAYWVYHYTHLPNIKSEYFVFSPPYPTYPVMGQTINATVKLKNYEPKPIFLNSFGLANYYITGSLWKPFCCNYNNFTIASGELKTFTFSRTADALGDYRAWLSMNAGGIWYDVKERYYSYNYKVNP